ncbi:glycosyltransferase family 2 protein [Protaetiibacter sp. SSC-01]|uniref:glycosyltransferase family 2 protein n=1 Tax=Protaetiibacter sp. SSC-01 TaxID=2759943 RepID=UPI001657607C|nr:glycosyltransferase family 2 protein [Protaetiibacter sp. SSC-01]QNO38097.1 glycosyltransferase family 2 protein [Protaetiibacter sp. SSC-01]
MTESPTVSVVVTFYNNVDYVERALRQLALLDEEPFEVLVTDDGSTDGTADLLRAGLDILPGARLIAVRQNSGIAAMRNLAVREARGDYVWFLDADDVWLPEAAGELRRLIGGGAADIAMVRAKRGTTVGDPRAKVLDSAAAGAYEGDDVVRLLLTGGVRGYLWNKAIRRTLLAAHPFPERRAQEDFAVISEILLAGARLVVSDRVLYWHIERPGSLTNTRISDFSDLEETCNRVLELVGADPRAATRFADELAFFRQWFYVSSVVNTSIRLGVADARTAGQVRQARRSITFHSVRATARVSRREGLIALLIKTLGPFYPPVYRAYVRRERSSSA